MDSCRAFDRPLDKPVLCFFSPWKLLTDFNYFLSLTPKLPKIALFILSQSLYLSIWTDRFFDLSLAFDTSRSEDDTPPRIVQTLMRELIPKDALAAYSNTSLVCQTSRLDANETA